LTDKRKYIKYLITNARFFHKPILSYFVTSPPTPLQFLEKGLVTKPSPYNGQGELNLFKRGCPGAEGWVGQITQLQKKTERIRSFNLEKNYDSYMLTQEFSSIKIEIA